MRLATLPDGSRDGWLVVVSRDLKSAAPAGKLAKTMQEALDNWDRVRGELQGLYDALNLGKAVGVFPFNPQGARAPLPRAYQWLDASAFPSHGALMAKAFAITPPQADRPLMYQGMSHRFLSGTEDVCFPNEADGIDFEGEFGVVVDDVPMGVTPEAALGHIKLIVQSHDPETLRTMAELAL